jgi:gliding motility-associated-like protein
MYTFTNASHNLAGQITYRYLSPNTYEIVLTTYTDPFARGVDRCNVDIEIWGKQGNNFIKIYTIEKIPRENGPSGNCSSPDKMGVFIRPKIKKNIYRTVYTFNGPGTFALRYFDVARVDNVKNMNNSGATAFYVETILYNNPFLGKNTSPQLLNDPLDDACTNRLWTHNPGAYDPDGDSLAFSLIPCQQYDPPTIAAPIPVSNYQYPSNFGGSFTIDNQTGLITWDKPIQTGVYNISIYIEEFRNGRKLGSVIRDMAIFVKPCFNDPPIIKALSDTCVKPGQSLNFEVKVYDINPLDSVYFYLNNAGIGNNGPFSVSISPATFNPPLNFPVKTQMPNSIVTQFTWNVVCEHIRSQFYQVDFYAHDNLNYDPTLSANHITKIYVVPQPVRNLTATSIGRRILLTWDPHDCPNATGYKIYRSANSVSELDTVCCKDQITGLVGYSEIATLYGWNQNSYVDSIVQFQSQYCYRVVAFFDNLLSCPSNEVCIPFKQDFPLITNDSIDITDINGRIFVSWAKPIQLDTNFFPRPYTYKLYRGNGLNPTQFTYIADFPFEDTTFFDSGMNTIVEPYSYKLELYDGNNQLITNSNQASSIYLRVNPLDKAMELQWSLNVPWVNDSIQIWRSDNGINGNYVWVGTVPGNYVSFKDKGLLNDFEYCYFVRSYGKYSAENLKKPLINDSQKTCGIPKDKTPPCLPGSDSIFVNSDCELFQVFFNWLSPDTNCAGDIDYYEIYFQPASSNEKIKIYQGKDTSFIYIDPNLSIAGCFYWRATDTVGNVSPFSEPFCTENCPLLILPNVFTPNGDGINDILVPIEARSIKSIEFQVYDRWGVLIHTSQNIQKLWDGNTKNGKPAADGVYFYVAKLEVDKSKPFIINRFGHFTLLR